MAYPPRPEGVRPGLRRWVGRVQPGGLCIYIYIYVYYVVCNVIV